MGIGFRYQKKVAFAKRRRFLTFDRFERRIYIPLPDFEARRFLVENNLKKNKHTLSKQDIDEIAQKADG